MTSSNRIFRVTGSLCGEFTGHRWIPLTKASDAELWCFLWSAPWINGWVNNHEAGDLRRHHAHYDVIVIHAALDAHHSSLQRHLKENKNIWSLSYEPSINVIYVWSYMVTFTIYLFGYNRPFNNLPYMSLRITYLHVFFSIHIFIIPNLYNCTSSK